MNPQRSLLLPPKLLTLRLRPPKQKLRRQSLFWWKSGGRAGVLRIAVRAMIAAVTRDRTNPLRQRAKPLPMVRSASAMAVIGGIVTTIIAARAVVTRDVPPYAIVGGNPAKRLAGILPPFLDAANSAAEVRRIIDVVGPARTKEALLKELPNKKNEFRTRLALWVIDHLEKGRVI